MIRSISVFFSIKSTNIVMVIKSQLLGFCRVALAWWRALHLLPFIKWRSELIFWWIWFWVGFNQFSFSFSWAHNLRSIASFHTVSKWTLPWKNRFYNQSITVVAYLFSQNKWNLPHMQSKSSKLWGAFLLICSYAWVLILVSEKYAWVLIWCQKNINNWWNFFLSGVYGQFRAPGCRRISFILL